MWFSNPTATKLDRFFNSEFEKMSIPEKDEKEKGVEVSPEKEMYVLDWTDLELELGVQESFADELAELEVRFAGVTEGLPKQKRGEDGKMMVLVSQELIRSVMKSPPNPTPFPDYSVGSKWMTAEDLETVARGFRALKTLRDIDIIQQYRNKGYAYVEMLTDN